MTPVFLFCLSPISDVRTHHTNEGNTYTNTPHPTNSKIRHSSIMRWRFPILVSGRTFLSISVLSIKRLTFSSKVKPDKICVTILHVQTHASMFPVGLSFFPVLTYQFPLFQLLCPFNGILYYICLSSLCSNWWNSSVWHHIRVMWCCLKIWQCCCIWWWWYW